MEATVKIDGRDVRFKATAAVPLLYRRKFNRDLIRDLSAAAKAKKEDEREAIMETVERMAYIMACHADPSAVPDSLEAWEETISPMAIYAISPVIMALWAGDLEQLEKAQKKTERLTVSLQRLSSFSGPSSLESPSGILNS